MINYYTSAQKYKITVYLQNVIKDIAYYDFGVLFMQNHFLNNFIIYILLLFTELNILLG